MIHLRTDLRNLKDVHFIYLILPQYNNTCDNDMSEQEDQIAQLVEHLTLDV